MVNEALRDSFSWHDTRVRLPCDSIDVVKDEVCPRGCCHVMNVSSDGSVVEGGGIDGVVDAGRTQEPRSEKPGHLVLGLGSDPDSL